MTIMRVQKRGSLHCRHTQAGTVLLVGAIVLVAAALALAGCGSSEGTSASTSASPSAAGQPQTGGTLLVGIQAGTGEWDPVKVNATADIFLQHQVLENLVSQDADFNLVPVLATKWDSTDGKAWNVELRPGVAFSNGQTFTSADVVYTFDRLRAKDSPFATQYANVVTITAVDDMNVTFQLETVDSEFPALLSDRSALILCKDVADPSTELVGTGPFTLKSFAAEDRAEVVKNPTYWGKDAQGNQLPYLDGVTFVYSPDSAGQIAGLQGGALNWVGGLTAEQVQTVQADSALKVITSPSNNCYELQIRCDQGPGKSLQFRQALMAGTDLQGIVDLAAPGIADAGNGTFVGPAYKAYYLDQLVPYDTTKAKELLAQAGYGDGVKITLVTQNADIIPAIATAWQAQMKEIGVDVAIQEVPPDVYYADKGNDTWYQADFGIVDWGSRAVPSIYFNLALTSTAPWNYSRWKNSEFDDLVKQIPLALDQTQRADLYKQAQTLLQNQVPMINFLTKTAVAGQSANVEGVAMTPNWPWIAFGTAYFTE